MFFDIFLLILTGLLLRVLLTATGVSPEKIDMIRDKVNYFVFYYIIPFVCFKTTYSMPFSLNHLKISLVATLTILSCVFLSWFTYKLITLKKEIKSEVIGSLIMCSAFGNVLYIGLPILTKLYGAEGMSQAFTYDFLASTPLTWTVAVAICMKYGTQKMIKIRNSILTILRIPAIWALIAGFILRESQISLPEKLISLINAGSNYLTSFMLVIVGISIKAITPTKFILALPGVSIKVLMSPLLAFLFGNLLGLSGVPLNVCIIEAAMPSMLLSMIFATVFGVDLRTSIEMIFLTTAGFIILALLTTAMSLTTLLASL